MRKAQAVEFWKSLRENTSHEEVISAFLKRKSYPRRRTLQRLVNAYECFGRGEKAEIVAKKTGWTPTYIEKLQLWFEESLQHPALPATDAGKQELKIDTPHKQKMRELAGELRSQITLPPIWHTFVPQLKPQRYSYADRWRTYPAIEVTPDKRIRAVLSTDSEGSMEHLYEGLRRHLETGGFRDVLRDINNWKRGVEQAFQKWHDILKRALDEAAKGHREIPNDAVERNERTGYQVSFFTSACADAIEIAKGNAPPAKRRDFRYLRQPLITQDPAKHFWVLMRPGYGSVYVAKTESTAKRHQIQHNTLRTSLSNTEPVKEIVRHIKDLAETEERIRNRLQRFIDMESVPGQCELCSL
jgi:hypothetical protein